MTARTNAAAVQAVLLKDYRPGADLSPFIEAASALVDDAVATAASAKAIVIDAVRAELIERWLSAHMYCMADRQLSSRSSGGASGSFVGSFKDGLQMSTYGQMAVRLDPSGVLNNIDETQEATGGWLGTPPSQRIPYWQRR